MSAGRTPPSVNKKYLKWSAELTDRYAQELESVAYRIGSLFDDAVADEIYALGDYPLNEEVERWERVISKHFSDVVTAIVERMVHEYIEGIAYRKYEKE